MRIHPKYNPTVALSWQEDKDGTNKQANKLKDAVRYIKCYSYVTFVDIFVENFYILISIWTWLFVPEAKCMHQFMQNNSMIFTTFSNRDRLSSALTTNVRPETSRKLRFIRVGLINCNLGSVRGITTGLFRGTLSRKNGCIFSVDIENCQGLHARVSDRNFTWGGMRGKPSTHSEDLDFALSY